MSTTVATILLVGVDLFFRGKLDGLLAGHRLVTSDSVDPPDLVIADIARVEPEEVVEAWPDVPILGYTNHTDKSGLQRAHTAGFDQVIVKSALVERAPELVARAAGAARAARGDAPGPSDCPRARPLRRAPSACEGHARHPGQYDGGRTETR